MKPITLAATLLLSSLAHAQEWSRFRGPNGSGVASANGLPVRFGPETNLRWRAEVPFSASSPVLTERAVLVTATDEEHLLVMALDRATGEELWTRALERARTEEVFPANDTASPSPVTDGENVYAFFPELGLISLDEKGEERWRLPLGPFHNFYGMSSSPVLANGVVILLCDQQVGSFIIGVDAATGRERWRTERAGIIECWTTPVLYPSDAPEQVLVFGAYLVTSYAIASGKELWRMKGFGYTPVCSPVLSGDRLYVSVPDHAEAGVPDWNTLAGQADANRDGKVARTEARGEMLAHFGWADVDRDDVVTEEEWAVAYGGMNSKDYGLAAIDLAAEGGPRELWRYKKSLPTIASPLLYGGILYLARGGGLVTLVNAEDGEVVARERIADGAAECWSSPVAGDGKIFIADNSGIVTVVAPGPRWNVLATNELGEDCVATPAIGADALYVRTRSAVWSFGLRSDE